MGAHSRRTRFGTHVLRERASSRGSQAPVRFPPPKERENPPKSCRLTKTETWHAGTVYIQTRTIAGVQKQLQPYFEVIGRSGG